MQITIYAPLAIALLCISCALTGALLVLLVLVLLRRHPVGTPPPNGGVPADWLTSARQWAHDRGTPGLADWAEHRVQTIVDMTHPTAARKKGGRK